MKRRTFLKAAAGAVGGSAVAAPSMSDSKEPAVKEKKRAKAAMPQRVLGRTGEKISIVGFPGLALMRYEQDECTAALHDAFRRGVNYFDVAPAYGKGDAEIKMGIGLEGIDRDKYFLSCKTKMRDKAGAREELERSLDRLKTDRLDLYQLHCLKTPEEVQQALDPGGAMETIIEAQKEGKIRFIGFSAHTTKGALAAMKGFRFDTVMFPISFVEIFRLGFGLPVLKMAAEQGAAVLAIKSMCGGAWPEGMEKTRKCWYRPVEDDRLAGMAVRFTLSQKPVAAGIPPSFFDLTDKAIEAAKTFSPITKDETEELKQLALGPHESLFIKEEQKVACAEPRHEVLFPDSPHECGPDNYA